MLSDVTGAVQLYVAVMLIVPGTWVDLWALLIWSVQVMTLAASARWPSGRRGAPSSPQPRARLRLRA
jgi:hypothetical protein